MARACKRSVLRQVFEQPVCTHGPTGAELYAGRTQRVGGLQGVSALHPPPALRAVPDLDIETPHKGAHLRHFLILPRRAAAVRTRGPAPRRPRRRGPGSPADRSVRQPAVGRRPRPCAALAKGAACRRPARRASSSCFLRRAATLPSVPVAGGARQFTTQPADLAVLLLDALVRRITLAPGRLRTAKSAALASHTARIGTCAPNLHHFADFLASTR